MHGLFVVLAWGVCAAQAEPITFYKHIAAIVYQSCAPCHRPGEPGPFPLLTYTDVTEAIHSPNTPSYCGRGRV
jgi:hypothetical protein